MIAYLPIAVFTIAAALALGSIHASLRDAIRHMRAIIWRL